MSDLKDVVQKSAEQASRLAEDELDRQRGLIEKGLEETMTLVNNLEDRKRKITCLVQDLFCLVGSKQG